MGDVWVKCPWCEGDMQYEPSLPHTGRPGFECVLYNRSDDFWHEVDVMIKHAIDDEEYVNWHSFGTNKDYLYRKKLRLPPVSKKGRSGRRNKWG